MIRMMKLIKNSINNETKNNSGFTLVELVVVLLLMGILLSVTVFGGLAWQDWAQFRHEEAMAEEIFFAAQNQITELDSSGALDKMVTSKISSDDIKSKYELTKSTVSSISYKEVAGEQVNYTWGTLWSNSKVTTPPKTMVTLRAKAGDYSKYLNGDFSNEAKLAKDSPEDLGAKILFDLISPYVTDASALNGAIAVEFSPDAGQVFSVSYSDRTDKLVYGSGDGYGATASGTSIDITKRVIQDRENVMLGYYSVENLTNKKRGKSFSSSNVFLTIDNSEVFSLIVEDNNGEIVSGDSMVFTIYDGGNTGLKELMTITIPFDGVKGSLKAASNEPADATVSFKQGLYKNKEDVPFRIPVYSLNGKIYVVLDAADIQAQTLSFSKSIYFGGSFDTDDEKAFRNTYSFYRFGLSQDVQYIFADLVVMTGSTEKIAKVDSYDEDEAEYHKLLDVPRGGCTTFASFQKDDSTSAYNIEMTNMRHFYNMRYETDYKYSLDSSNSLFRSNNYILKNNISWKSFYQDYLLNSYKNTGVNSGISYGGGFASTNIDTTKVVPFPGFRKLDKMDTFTQKKAFGEEGHYTINDLTIKLSSNIVYGVYDRTGMKIKEECADESTSNPDTYSYILDSFSDQADKDDYKPARAGELPLGLFCENLGNIENITLNRHKVIGAEEVSGHFVYTCMVGGFAGNNLGSIKNLVLLDSTDNAETKKDNRANESKIIGRMDVGGIIGRQSFTVLADTKTVITGMKNYATVSGKEDVGGIVGRVYTNYVGENPDGFTSTYPNTTYGNIKVTSETLLPKYKLYLDGYNISDPSKDGYKKSMTGEEVERNSSVEISECINRGRVSGEKLFYKKSIYHYSFEGEKTDAGICSFIGGIAGCTMDGRIYDARKFNINNKNAFLTLCASYLNGSSQTIKVSKCSSYYAYEGIDSYEKLAIKMNEIYGSSIDNPLNKDNYVGGLIGYAKLTAIENCNDVPESDLKKSDGVPNTFVLGYRYVGGIVGCSDMSRFDNNGATQNALTKRTYSVTNYNNVIGRAFIGGIAGGFGIGDCDKESFSYKTPSSNEASIVCAVCEDKTAKIDLVHNVLNTGCVLALNDNGNDLKYSVPLNNGTYPTPKVPSINYNGNYECGYAGGVVGVSRIPINNCDSIQPDCVKEYVMTMITGSYKDYYNISAVDLAKEFDTENKVDFGGKCVGGIAGFVSKFGKINEVKDSYSYVDSVVFGRYFVGGAVGTVSFLSNNYMSTAGNNERTCDIRNIYPLKSSESRGLLVVGETFVGGVVGKLEDYNGILYDSGIDTPYTVKGRVVVGGILGLMIQNKSNSAEIKTSVNITDSKHATISGLGYVGGYAGCNNGSYFSFDGANNSEYDLNGIDVNAKCFAGGIIGLVTRGNNLSSVQNLSMGDNVNVYAECFAGGIAGLYTTEKNDIDNPNRQTNNRLYRITYRILDSDYQGIYSYVVENDVNGVLVQDSDKKREIFDQPTSSSSVVFDDYTSYSNASSTNIEYTNIASVNADLFAGGLFGYVPNGQKVKVEGFVNNGSVTVNKNVNNVTESSNKSVYYSYLGGVIGRVPSGMELINCANCATGSDKYNSGVTSNNTTTYLGGLTEVNAGVITGKVVKDDQGNVTSIDNYLVNKTDYKYSSGGIGAFAGINGTSRDGCAGVIQYARNEGTITSTNGFAGGITAVDESSSSVTHSINIGTITAKEAAGIVARVSGTDTITHNRNYGTIKGSDKSFGIAAGTATRTAGSVSKNLEASGLDNGTGNDPVAELDTTNLKNNFFIRGVYSLNGQSGSSSGSSDPDDYIVTVEDNSGAKDIKIDVSSPSSGLSLDTLKLYWKFHTTDITQSCNYLVSFTYLDGEGDEQTVYRYRTFTFTPDSEGDTEINKSFYDDISVVDMNGQAIKPIFVQIHIDNPGNTTIASETFTYNKDAVSGTSTMSNDVDAATIGDYIDGSTNRVASSSDYPQPKPDSWSKRLIVTIDENGTKNLSYKRYGSIQGNLMSKNTAIDVAVEAYNSYEKYAAFDSWFTDEFIDNSTYFGDGQESRFVD